MEDEKETKTIESVKKGKVKSKKNKKVEPKKVTLWTFPKNTLEEAINIPRAIEEKNAGNPMHASELAKAVGYKLSSDWRFKDLLRSANLYGLVNGSGANATISLEKMAQDIVAPSSSSDRQKALLGAFRNVPDFKDVEKFYGGKKIPEDEFFANTLTRQFKIPRDRVEKFSEIFMSNLAFLNAFDVLKNTDISNIYGVEKTEEEIKKTFPKTISKEPRIREYLDTCFMMMPFGEWFDKYYQVIYVPAIKEAGFEPIRADELFTTGSVVEQIWEQIVKSKVLIAELTDKNANVFYELGLAHAAKKPVVFLAQKVDDVPFDLRHLRVIIYETKEPDWANKLKRNMTDYLKNALKEPEKSIPHPFRTLEDAS